MDQSGPGSNDHEGVLHITQISRIGTSPSDDWKTKLLTTRADYINNGSLFMKKKRPITVLNFKKIIIFALTSFRTLDKSKMIFFIVLFCFCFWFGFCFCFFVCFIFCCCFLFVFLFYFFTRYFKWKIKTVSTLSWSRIIFKRQFLSNADIACEDFQKLPSQESHL